MPDSKSCKANSSDEENGRAETKIQVASFESSANLDIAEKSSVFCLFSSRVVLATTASLHDDALFYVLRHYGAAVFTPRTKPHLKNLN
jgi:hypothetical protein